MQLQLKLLLRDFIIILKSTKLKSHLSVHPSHRYLSSVCINQNGTNEIAYIQPFTIKQTIIISILLLLYNKLDRFNKTRQSKCHIFMCWNYLIVPHLCSYSYSSHVSQLKRTPNHRHNPDEDELKLCTKSTTQLFQVHPKIQIIFRQLAMWVPNLRL